VNRRITWAQADLLVDGALSLESTIHGGAVAADFGVPGGQKGVVPAGAAWSNTSTSVPITDLMAWQATFRAANGGRNPDFWITSTPVINDLTLNAQIRALTPANADGGVRGVVTSATVGQVMQQHGIAPFVPVDLELPAVDGSGQARLFPVRAVIGVIVDRLGSTLFGPTADAANMAGNGTISFSDASGVIAFVERDIRPARVITTAAATCLPVLRDPNALFSASV
jgi:hypothetical protein